MYELSFAPWSVTAQGWSARAQNQTESIFCQGNGYLGLRNAAEEAEPLRLRGLFVNGCFDAPAGDVPELPNLPDPCGMEILLNGQPLLLPAESADYRHTLDLRTGLSTRILRTGTPGVQAEFCFERFVSLAQRHLICQRVRVTAVDTLDIEWTAALDAGVTNSGVQHLGHPRRRCGPGEYALMELDCLQSGVTVCLAGAPRLSVPAQASIAMERRSIGTRYRFALQPGQSAELCHFSAVYTARDREYLDAPFTGGQDALACCTAAAQTGFDALLAQSAGAWAQYWTRHDIQVDSENAIDQTALRFALYHLRVMTPVHDDRMNIGAKGLSGEAYKGHVFWDTEMFLLPLWLLTEPQAAQSLLRYRWHTLPAARQKAAGGGFAGAQMPWESTWITEGEATPAEGDPDVVTGKPIPIRTGEQEIHISADVAWAVHCYRAATGDDAFMRECGDELILSTAVFWASRAQWNETARRYEICGVTGPDEYSETVNNNAYTNHLAAWNLRAALDILERLYAPGQQDAPRAAALLERLQMDRWEARLRDVAQKLYCPQPGPDGVIPQDDVFCTLPMPDLTPYKQGGQKLLEHYNIEQLRGLRVSKQADVAMLLTVFPDAWPQAVRRANYDAYEPCCVHDSSLSFNVYSRLAAAAGLPEDAYRLFEKAARVDLNASRSSVQGIHAAAMGGIWLCVVEGFAGVQARKDALCFCPRLPAAWHSLRFALCWHGRTVRVELTPGLLRLEQDGEEPTPVEINGTAAMLGERGEWTL